MSLNKWFEGIGDRFVYIAIGIGLWAGLLGAYGRERNDGRRPGSDWIINRLLIMPLLGITTSALASTLLRGLPLVISTFIATVLALLGYDAVRIIETRGRRSVERGIDAIGDVIAGPARDGSEMVAKIEPGSGTPQTVTLESIPPAQDGVALAGRSLRRAFKPTGGQSAELTDLLKRLDPEGD